jgi:RHS repeat-associated protein
VLEEVCASLPFGDQLQCSGSPQSPNEQHFTGKERDQESGLDYFGARYYASSMGRFLSPDWSAKIMPVPYAKLDNPQSLNLYSYVLNNPLTGIDADGHQCDICQKALNWLTSSHSASASASATAAQGSASNGGLSATARAGTAQASAIGLVWNKH